MPARSSADGGRRGRGFPENRCAHVCRVVYVIAPSYVKQGIELVSLPSTVPQEAALQVPASSRESCRARKC